MHRWVVHTRETSFHIAWHSENHTQSLQFIASSIDTLPESSELVPFTHIPYEHDAFAWVAGLFSSWKSADHVEVLVEETSQVVDRSLLRTVDTLEVAGPVWCPVGTIVESRPYGPGGQERRRGTRHFMAGAKVYYTTYAYSGNIPPPIRVVGRHRATHRYVEMVIRPEWVTQWRVELVYSPHLIRALWPWCDGTPEGKTRAIEEMGRVMYYSPTEQRSPDPLRSEPETTE